MKYMDNKWELPLNFSYKFIFQNEKLVSILGPSFILISTKSQNLKTTTLCGSACRSKYL